MLAGKGTCFQLLQSPATAEFQRKPVLDSTLCPKHSCQVNERGRHTCQSQTAARVLLDGPGLLLPTENIALRQSFDPKPVEHVQQMGPMVHPVSNDVGNASPIRLLGRRTIQPVDPPLIPSAALVDGSGYPFQVGTSTIQPSEQHGHGPALEPHPLVRTHRLAGHEIGPHLDIADDVQERGPHSPLPDVELTIELLIGQVAAAQEQLVRRPGVMFQQAVQQINQLPPKWSSD